MSNLDETLRNQECEGSKHYTGFIRSNGMAKCKFCHGMFYVTRTNSLNVAQIPTHYRRSLSQMSDETYTPQKQEFSEKEWNLIYTAVIDRFTESKEGVPMDDIENRYSGQWWELCVKVSEHRQALERKYCRYCDHDAHRCPGCGEPISHSAHSCSACHERIYKAISQGGSYPR